MAYRPSLKRPRLDPKLEEWGAREKELTKERGDEPRSHSSENSSRRREQQRRRRFRRQGRQSSNLVTIMSTAVFLVALLSVNGCTAFQGRGETSFGSYIRHEQQEELQGRPLPPDVMFNDPEFQIPKDVDVKTPLYPIQDNNTFFQKEVNEEPVLKDVVSPAHTATRITSEMTRQSGNPKVEQTIPVDAQMTLSIEPEVDVDLLVQDMEEFLEHYLEKQFQQLIDFQNDKFSLTTPILQLQKVDLSVALVDGPSRRRTRGLRATPRKLPSGRPLLQAQSNHLNKSRNLQQSSRLATVSVFGEVAYSMQVDGGSPTPTDIDQEWNAALANFISQPRLDEAIADACVEGVVRVDEVSSFSLQAPPEDQTEASTTSGTSDSVVVSSSTAENGGAPWEDSPPSSFSNSRNSSELIRPSTLSIIFGFVLTGIAALGLVGYCYIFYRKRKKHLRKKKQMKETITYPARSASVAAAPITTRTPPGPPPALPVVTNPMILAPVDDTFSEDTSYKGIESSIGSEDASDAFAKELQKAASLDQEAWDEFQKRKEALDQNQSTPRLHMITSGNVDKKSTRSAGKAREIPPALLGPQNLSSDEEGILDYNEGVEADLEGKPSRSYPYGDEGGNEYDDEWVENPLTPRSQQHQVQGKQWEPYNSALPPSPDLIAMEEKKDEISPSGFFAKELQNIEMDLARYGGQSGMDEISLEDDGLSNVDMMSEVEELSKYVRRYEKRKDRKIKREIDVHERFSVGGTSSVGTGSMSIGMDGRVYNPYGTAPNLEPSTPSSMSTMSSVAPPSEKALSSYAGSYLQQRDGRNDGILSFVSDEEESDDDKEEDSSIKSQRLGISPFSVSQPDGSYYSRQSMDENASSTRDPTISSPTISTRAGPSSSDDYRNTTGYGYDLGLSDTKRNSLASKSSLRSTSRLSNLRSNDAIIDGSNSDVNATYDPHTNRSTMGPVVPDSDTSKRSLSRLSFRRDTGATSSSIPVESLPTSPSVPNRPKPKKTNNNRFDRLRGMFEQKATEQPAPIYPPGEHWQYEGHKKNGR